MMIDHIHQFVIPAAYSLLPEAMRSDKATALLIAIGLQESLFLDRKQINGTARSFWQFELIRVKEVLRHERSKAHADALIDLLRYRLHRHSPSQQASAVYGAMADNDVLASGIARLNLWILPAALPGPDDATLAWNQYLLAWKPGKPHPDTWNHHYAEAWARMQAARPTGDT